MQNSLKDTIVETPLTSVGQSVLQVLLYFDIFNYPLTPDEIYTFSNSKLISTGEIIDELNALKQQGFIFEFNRFFGLQNDVKNSLRRIQGNKEAEKYIPLAMQRARLIARFPFVRAVMASGSLSKGYMDEKSDLDFFVITDPGRLWMARTLFVLYRKLFIPKKRYKEFCTNYFLTSNRLEIEEKNIFTATELATLIPLHNSEMHTRLLSANRWVNAYFPNFKSREGAGIKSPNEMKIKKILEGMISFVFRSRTDNFLMRLTLRKFARQHGNKFTHSEFSLAFKSRPYVSKGHLGNNQSRVLNLLQERKKAFEARFAIALSND